MAFQPRTHTVTLLVRCVLLHSQAHWRRRSGHTAEDPSRPQPRSTAQPYHGAAGACVCLGTVEGEHNRRGIDRFGALRRALLSLACLQTASMFVYRRLREGAP